jgi:hypothetical protein
MIWTIEAVVKNGEICLKEPLPPEWTEGSRLWIQLEYAPPSPAEQGKLDQDGEDLEPPLDEAEFEKLQAFLAKMRQDDRALARKKAGLP